jgi:hypothetical protein
MKLSPDRKAGLYITAIIHLAVIVVLLAARVGYEVKQETSFVLDFTRQEEMEKEAEQEELQRLSAQQLEEMIAAARANEPLRNVAVDRATLKDDRGTNAEELYREAERLARELQEGKEQAHPDDVAETPVQKPEAPKQETKAYSGPSVLAWSLDGRQASHLPIPAYRCFGAGEVTVVITVDNQGKVVHAKVDESLSTDDNCLRTYATRAARLSRFSPSATAPARQLGTITYAFIAQ